MKLDLRLPLLLALGLLVGCSGSKDAADGGSPPAAQDAGADAGAAPEAAHDDPRVGAPLELLTQLQKDLPALDASAREVRIDQFLAEVAREGGAPLRSGNDVYFLYRGSGAAYVSGDWNGWAASSASDQMLPVQGTSLQVAQRHFGDQERHLYKLVVAGSYIEDPLDPWVVWDGIDPGGGLGSMNGVVTMPAHGLVEGATHRESFHSDVEGNTRDVFVYLPKQYFAGADRMAALYNHDGREALTKGQFDQAVQATFDTHTAKPLLLVTIALEDQANRGNEYVWDGAGSVAPSPRGQSYRQLMADELVPFIDAHYRTLADAADRIVAGQSLGGLISAYIAYGRPEVFGNAACQSATFGWNGNEMISTVANGGVVNVRWYLDSGTGSGSSDDNYPVTTQMKQALDARGYTSTQITEQGGTHDWPHWHGRFHGIPEYFFPQ